MKIFLHYFMFALLLICITTNLHAEKPWDFPGVALKVRYFEGNLQTTHQSCLTVFPDNHYRLIRVNARRFSDPETHVFSGTMTQANADDLTNILQSEEFKKLQSATPLGPRTPGDIISYQIYVPRPDRNQVLIFESEGTTIHSPPKPFVA